MKQTPRISYRQLKLLESEIAIRVDERVQGEVVNTLADLLLEALGAVPDETAKEFAGRQIPEPDRTIRGAGDGTPAVGANC